MTHKTDMREALQLCIDAMLHDGVPTDPYHPRRVALRAALACRPDAQESLASENVDKDSTPKVSQGLAQADERGAFLHAAINCPHEIDSNRVVLHYDDKQPGHNALAQLGDRLVRAAAPQAEAAQEQVGKAEPIAWIRFCGDGLYEGPIMNCDRRKMDEIVRVKPDEWRALVLRNDSTQENGCLTRKSMQEKALEHGFEYWRAPDEHGITGTKPQCIEFLQDLLGVEVEIEDNGCQTCNGTGMIGGPSFYAPDEGGEPCPDCCDTPSYCSSVRRCTAKDASPSRECGERQGAAQSVSKAVATLRDLDRWLGNSGYDADHPWRLSIARALVSAPTETVPKWVFDNLVDTLEPAWDYIQTHQKQFSATAGDDKTKILVDEFLRHAASAPTLGEPVPLRDIRMLAGYAEGSKSPRVINAFRRVMRWLDDAPAVAQEGTHSVSALDLLADRDAEFRAAVVQPSTDILRSYFETIVKYLEADLPGLALNTAEKARALLAKGE